MFAQFAYTASLWPCLFFLPSSCTRRPTVGLSGRWATTAYRQGRVSFNPLRHVDGMGTVLLLALLIVARVPFLFGWAKLVPVNFSRLRNPRRDIVVVAAAGPTTNLGLADISA
jgi:Zn-dependent protease